MQAYLEENRNEYVPGEVYRIENSEESWENGKQFDIVFLENGNKQEEALVWVRQGLMDAVVERVTDKTNSKAREPVLIRANGSYYRVEPEKVLYAESVGRKVVLHMKNSEIAYYAKMKETEEMLGSRFFRCHRGYLVNFEAVKSYETGSILLKNGETILMARRKYNDFAAAYAEYLRTC